ncbi:MAG TPA: hypothetical protein PLV59_02535 [Candidatus Dojkabacteria bacterium]|nr:hypothetical protein [Candidatus Dojkabacteria bacterium]
MQNILNKLLGRWFACRVTSGRQSALYGMRFSYPLYILIVVIGVLTTNVYIIIVTSIIALMGVLLPMHPFDYIYNAIAKYIPKLDRINGRGTEMQVTSVFALLFNIIVIAMLLSEIKINYTVLASIYTLASFSSIVIQIKTND